MLALVPVVACCLYLIGLRADRVHAQRTAWSHVGSVTEPGIGGGEGTGATTAASANDEQTALGFRPDPSSGSVIDRRETVTEPVALEGGVRAPTSERAGIRREPVPGSVTVPLYRGRSARFWNGKFVRMRHLAYQRGINAKRARRALAGTRTYPVYGLHWLERAFMCVHGFEGSWTDPAAPFYGGLQMDMAFQRTYGGWALKAFGTADRWPVSVQLSTAIQAYESGRGFYPWPQTARYCGLI